MPMHDWTRVSAGTYHDFHCTWLADLKSRLNTRLLPADHYAQVEQVMEGMIADILTLSTDEPDESGEEVSEGGLALAVAPPRVRITEELEADIYSARARQIAIRHSSDDRMVAVIELVSPGNKASEDAWDTFVSKSLAALRQGIHLLILDIRTQSKDLLSFLVEFVACFVQLLFEIHSGAIRRIDGGR